jgi:hypothetical protein
MFVVMTTFAVIWGYFDNWIRQRHEVLEVPGVIGITEVDVEQYEVPLGGGAPMLIPTDPRPAPWPLSWFGEQGYVELLLAQGKSEAELARALFPEARIDRD